MLIFTVGYDHIYGHMQGELHGLPHGKALWLSRPWMFGRLFVGLSLLYWLGWKLVRTDLTPDLAATKSAATGGRRALAERWTRDFDGSEGALERVEHRLRVLAPVYVVVYALVFTLVAFDGIMALQPHWFSNLLGGWYFMGSFLGAHMLLALHMIYAGKHLDVEDLISPKQRHDLGKLCFGFSVFWTYLMWAQFQVIWYANLPEETGFVFSRLWGPWIPVARAVLLGMFVIPFATLLGVAPKKSRVILGTIAVVSLSALWLERFLLIVPSITEEAGPHIGVAEFGADGDDAGAVPAGLRAVRPHLPDDLAAPRRDHAQPGAASPRGRDLRPRGPRRRLRARGGRGAEAEALAGAVGR